MTFMKMISSHMFGHRGLRVAAILAMFFGLVIIEVKAQTLMVVPRPSSSAGTVSPSSSPVTTQPQIFALSQLAKVGYVFDHWEIATTNSVELDPGVPGQSTNDDSIIVRVLSTNDSAVVRAWFKDARKTLIVSCNPTNGGYVAGDWGVGTNMVTAGTTVTLIANASNNFEFVSWSGSVPSEYKYNNTAKMTINSDSLATANFYKWLDVIMTNYYGPEAFVGPNAIALTYLENSTNVMLRPQSPLVSTGEEGSRYHVAGWTNGAGNVFPSARADVEECSIAKLTQNSSLTWLWKKQYLISVSADVGLSVSVDKVYVNEGGSITLYATVTDSKYELNYWKINGETKTANPDGSYLLSNVTQAVTARAVSRLYQAPLIPQWYQDRWKMDSKAGYPNGPADDPDNDGLSNYTEYQLSNTNVPNSIYNPFSADTDGDLMDDFYETYSIDPTNFTTEARSKIRPAATDPLKENGQTGNPDGDFHWRTTDGYQDKAWKLTNFEEYCGPDTNPPYFFVTYQDGDLGYPLTNNAAALRPDVIISEENLLDTGDQSDGNTVDTDDDKFDDGYEYSWDKWQQTYGETNELLVIGTTNVFLVKTNTLVPLILSTNEVIKLMSVTNFVPAWDGVTNITRRFNPATQHAASSLASGESDDDVLYDYETGGVSPLWYTDLAEYNAWKPTSFSQTVPNAPHFIRMDNPPPDDPAPQRSSHPFLTDVDRDGMPDGWEVIFDYDPWIAVTPGHSFNDGVDNPDVDYMARSNTNSDWACLAARSNDTTAFLVDTNLPIALRHHQVYVFNNTTNYDPRTGWGATYPVPKDMPGAGAAATPKTAPYSNIEEIRGADGRIVMIPRSMAGEADDATNPYSNDSDGDGIWDGWEAYVGLDPNNERDAILDTDKDKLTNFEEFQSFVTSSTNRLALVPVVGWFNKIFPTDTLDKDTDGDELADFDEKGLFNGGTAGDVTNLVFNEDGELVPQVFTVGTWNGSCYSASGLNPTSSDTDTDTLPDPYEASFAAAIDGTKGDALADPDSDKLKNYQEYLTTTIYHWQFNVWLDGEPYYNSGDFFAGRPKSWDWSQTRYIPMFFGPAKPIKYSYGGSDPGMSDSDDDGMDDYYEIYHGLNPLYGRLDLVQSSIVGAEVWAGMATADPRLVPHVNGSPYMDSDGDGLPNVTESVNSKYTVQSPNYHTDPTPLWMTDTEYDRSWVNLYYVPGNYWFWSGKLPPPTYAYDFESNEGYDTDNDGVGDREELTVTKTDPLTPERPVKRRALKLPPSLPAYARTFPGYAPGTDFGGGGYMPGAYTGFYTKEVLRSYTVEAWVRPLTPASGENQVIVERPLLLPVGNTMILANRVRLNFRLGIDGAGVPYVTYNGDGEDKIFHDVKAAASAALTASNWVHLAGTYQVASSTNASQGGVLSLYVNGRLMKQEVTSELPAIGRYVKGNIITVYGGPIVVGAGDNNPEGEISGYGASYFNPPSPTNFFKGWLDEVRVWDGSRSADEITAGMGKRMKQADVSANAGLATSLYYLYSFDALTDPDHSPKIPTGFDVIANATAPADWPAVGFWGPASQHSLVYTDYRYLPWIENAAVHLPEIPATDMGDTNTIAIMSGTNVVGQALAFWNTSNPYGNRYFTAPALTGQKKQISSDLLPLGWAVGDEDVPMWDNGTVPATEAYDSDGDGLPDSWEELYGLDPLDPTGNNGASADPDQDGLSNMAEFLAETDPRNSDTYGWGFGDYNSWKTGTVYRTYGELYTDHDGMPDAWEMLNGLDTRLYDAYGVYGDPDGDGWANFTEYMKATDPKDLSKHPNPIVNGIIKYNGVRTSGSVIVMGYQKPSMDGVPIMGVSGGGVVRSETESLGSGDGQTTVFTGKLKHGSIVKGSVKVRRLNPQFVTPDFDFTDNAAGDWTYYPDYFSSQSTTNVTFDYGTGDYTFRWPAQDGFGMVSPWNGDQIFIDYQWKDGDPNSFSINGLKDGELYLFAYRDNNGNSQWDAGEPAGIAERQPIHLGWEDLTGVVIGLTDDPPAGHLRFGWPVVVGQESYILRVVNKSATGSPMVFSSTNSAPLNWFHEGQMNNLGIFNLPEATYQWFAKKSDGVTEITNGLFNVVLPSNTKPTLLSPMGSFIDYSSMELIWTMDKNADRFRIQISRDSGFSSPVYDETADAPFRAADASYRYTLPIYPGDETFTNGLYYWRVAGVNNKSTSSWADSSQFTVNLTNPPVGASTISGDVKYYGKAGGPNTITIILQAYKNAGFGGEPLAQITITNKPDTNTIAVLSGSNAPAPSITVTPFDKGAYKFMGLRSGVYYIRAFMDMNGNGRADIWETQGFVANTAGRPRGNLVGTGSIILNQDLALEDRDLDSDGLPDAWEWVNFGTLRWTGNDDPDGTGATLMKHYGDTYFDSDPRQKLDPLVAYEMNHNLAPGADSDRDGLSDAVEVLVTRTNPFTANDALRARQFIAAQPGSGMNLTWDGKDGVNYQVQVSSNLKTWADAPMGAFSGPGTKTFVDTASAGLQVRFYRIVVR
jgi:uncharacterized protein (DUF2141 family)